MKFKRTFSLVLLFGVLLILILSLKTEIHVCNVCGVQEYERSIFGKTLEVFSEREVDELGSYQKWKELNDTICNHQWIRIDEYGNVKKTPE